LEEKDSFAVWMADTVLRANNQDIEADLLMSMAEEAVSPAAFDEALKAASTSETRPGDMGLEFLGPLLPVVLVEFGRLVWQAYAKSLMEEGAKAAAAATIDAVKSLVKKSFAHAPDAPPMSDIENSLRAAAAKAGVKADVTEQLVASLRSQAVTAVVAKG